MEATAVGENQIETLGKPKLIILPSPYGLSEAAWVQIASRVREGAILVVSGPFGGDEHLHPTGRMRQLGITGSLFRLQIREESLHTPFGVLPLRFEGMSMTILDRFDMADGSDFAELPLGKGQVLFSALPLELNSNLDSVARVYEHALKLARVPLTYSTTVTNAGILICPTRLPHATLYVLTSETEDSTVSFTDEHSDKLFSGKLDAGRAALLLISERGELLTSYNWNAHH